MVHVITGAGGGMGREVAKSLGGDEPLLLTDLDAAALRDTEAALEAAGVTEVTSQTADITAAEAVDELVRTAESMGQLRSFVHTAGLSPTMADAETIIEVNLIATAQLLNRFHELAAEHTVAVVFSSMSAYMVPRDGAHADLLTAPLDPDFLDRLTRLSGDDSGAAYAFSKLGVQLVVEEQATAWAERGARIVSLSPGIIDTPMGRQEAAQQPEMQGLVDGSALQRQGTPAEIAGVVEFLVSEDASYVTGTDILVDGGAVAGWDGDVSPTVARIGLAVKYFLDIRLRSVFGRIRRSVRG